MRYVLMAKEQLDILCAKPVGMTLGGSLHRGK